MQQPTALLVAVYVVFQPPGASEMPSQMTLVWKLEDAHSLGAEDCGIMWLAVGVRGGQVSVRVGDGRVGEETPHLHLTRRHCGDKGEKTRWQEG